MTLSQQYPQGSDSPSIIAGKKKKKVLQKELEGNA